MILEIELSGCDNINFDLSIDYARLQRKIALEKRNGQQKFLEPLRKAL